MDRRKFMRLGAFGMLGASAFGLTGCGSGPSVDLMAALRRTSQALEIFTRYMRENNIEKAGDKELAQFTGFLNRAMNVEPKLYPQPIVVKMRDDASFDAYADANGDGKVDGEKKLFKVEIDSANKRLIATDASGKGTFLGSAGMGFLAGALMGSLLNRQRRAGVSPGSFNNRRLTRPSAYARSRARAGGLFGGK